MLDVRHTVATLSYHIESYQLPRNNFSPGHIKFYALMHSNDYNLTGYDLESMFDVPITCSSHSLLLRDINPWMYHANDNVHTRAHCQRRLCEFCHSGPVPWRIYDADNVSRTLFDYAICSRRDCYKS